MTESRLHIIKEALYSYGASHLNENIFQTISLDELFAVVLLPHEDRLAFRAAWALEHILLNNTHLFDNNIDRIENVYFESNNWSVLRSMTKLMMAHTEISVQHLPESSLERMIDKTFRLLEDKDCPIAVRCNAYEILFQLAIKEKWIARELTTQITYDLEKHATAALLSRGRRVLKKLERIF